MSALPALAKTTTTRSSTTRTGPKLNIGLIGVGGHGATNLKRIAEVESSNIVAICDVDSGFLATAAKGAPEAKRFVDFRELLDARNLDAVVISTPDHTHAHAAAMAMRKGKHVYLEKPLTHTIEEARLLTDLAAKTGVVTQTGMQMHAFDHHRQVVELICAGAIGAVREVHLWNSRVRAAVSEKPIDPPARLNYDLWLGPLKPRPYLEGFHPFTWRYWWAFGNGLLGDMAPHYFDLAFWALDLESPTRIETKGFSPGENITARWVIANFEFPARGSQPPVKLTWYDPPHRPPKFEEWKLDPEAHKDGVMFIGDEGQLFTTFKEHHLMPEEKFKTFEAPKPSIARSPGHHREWIDACLKKDPTSATAPLAYGARIVETSILGAIAFRAGKALDWDAQQMRFPNAPEAEKFLRTEYRAGWSL